MDKQKRIEEMANEIAKACPDLAQDSCNGIPCVTCLTTTLVNAGYGNLKEFAKRLKSIAFNGYKDGTTGEIVYAVTIADIDELLKEYGID